MSVGLSKIKAGDEVTARFRVRRAAGRRPGYLDIDTIVGGVPIHRSTIVSHTPKPPAVGDWVGARGRSGVWQIGHIHERWAWLLDKDDCGVIALLSDLEPADV